MPKILPLVLVSLLLVFGVMLFWWPKYQAFADLKTRIEIKKGELESKNKYFSQLGQLDAKLKEYETQLASINSALPAKPGETDLLNFLSETVSQNGLVLDKVNLGSLAPVTTGSKIIKVSVSFSVSGTYLSFKNFLLALQKNARIFEIESITFSSPDKGDVFSFDLIIRAHSY